MANLFLGFPVSRAKIADIVEGSAPPKEHGVWHEPDGSDPIVLPEDIESGQIVKWDGSKFIGVDLPSGGAAFPWDGINIGSIFEGYHGYDMMGSEGSEYYVNADGLTLHWRSESTSIISATRKLFGDDPIPVWTKRQRFDVALRCWSAAPGTNESYAIRGNPDGNYFGFFSAEGDLLGVMGNSSGESGAIVLISSPDWLGHAKTLSARLDPDTCTCTYYVNGTLMNSLTSDEFFPAGDNGREVVLFLGLWADNINDYTVCNYWNFWQEL